MPSGDEALRLKATSRSPGRDDKSAQFNRIWYEMRLAEKLAGSVKSNQAKQFRWFYAEKSRPSGGEGEN